MSAWRRRCSRRNCAECPCPVACDALRDETAPPTCVVRHFQSRPPRAAILLSAEIPPVTAQPRRHATSIPPAPSASLRTGATASRPPQPSRVRTHAFVLGGLFRQANAPCTAGRNRFQEPGARVRRLRDR